MSSKLFANQTNNDSNKLRVLVMDASQRAALACTRSLGQSGYEVITADETDETLAGASKYSIQSIVYPSPHAKPQEFIEWAKQNLQSLKFQAVLPVTEVTTDLIVRNRKYWPEVNIPFAAIEKIDRLSNKVELFQMARTLGVPVPDSVVVDQATGLGLAAESVGVPGVLKPARSRILVGDEWMATTVHMVHSREELDHLAETLPSYYFPALYQQFVPGKGCGIFTIYRNNIQHAYFAHNRLREKPPEGGVSVLSESRLPDEELLGWSTKLLDMVGWNGVAMVEYRASDESGAYLMEVNARLWGSLQLAIDAGVDFPLLLLEEQSTGKSAMADYHVGVKLRWFFGDLDRLYLLFKNWRAVGVVSLFKECVAFCATFFSKSKNETFRLDDPAPGMHEIKQYFKSLPGPWK